jgi:hypothetical protein
MPIDRVCLANFLKTYSKSNPLYFDFDRDEYKRQALAKSICDYIEDLYEVSLKPAKLFTEEKEDL